MLPLGPGPLRRPRFGLDGLLGTVKRHTADGPISVLRDEAEHKDPRKKPLINQGVLMMKLKKARSWQDVENAYHQLLRAHDDDRKQMYEQILYMNSELIEGLYHVVFDPTHNQTPFLGFPVSMTIKAAEVFYHFYRPSRRDTRQLLLQYRNRPEERMALLRWLGDMDRELLMLEDASDLMYDEALLRFMAERGTRVNLQDVEAAMMGAPPSIVRAAVELADPRQMQHGWMNADRFLLYGILHRTDEELRELLAIPFIRRHVTEAILLKFGSYLPGQPRYLHEKNRGNVQAKYEMLLEAARAEPGDQ